MNDLYILDLDHTIFDTDRFHNDLLDYLSKNHGIDRRTLAISERNFRSGEDNRYDFMGHVLSHYDIPLRPIMQGFLDSIEPNTYLYDDVVEFLAQHEGRNDVRILTVGHDNFQTFKLATSPLLLGIPSKVLDHNKGMYLRSTMFRSPIGLHVGSALSNHAYQNIILIDDKPVTFSYVGPSDDFLLYRIARPRAKYSDLPSPSHVRTISSLRELA